MRDPLPAFDWSSLYRVYDAQCGSYASDTRCLDRFGLKRPATDRELYYELVKCYCPTNRVANPDVIGTYQSLLYWKLYSTGGAKGTNILAWLALGSEGRRLAELHLPSLLARLPATAPRNVQQVVKMVRELPSIPGMGKTNECKLPVRTTFLHFLYPSTVPIFDKMVLQAVGVHDKGANQDIDVFERYLPYVWSLSDKYSAESVVCNLEEPLRRIDMALWIMRDSTE